MMIDVRRCFMVFGLRYKISMVGKRLELKMDKKFLHASPYFAHRHFGDTKVGGKVFSGHPQN
jgi:hypothetical protein